MRYFFIAKTVIQDIPLIYIEYRGKNREKVSILKIID